MLTEKPLLICIVGPTGIGKTALSIQLANIFNTEIISADSRQFYKEMNIGTAVPTTDELSAVKHHFIQHKSILETYSVGDFERDAISKLEELYKIKNVAVMVGGSGLYVDAVVNGLDHFPPVPEGVRVILNNDFQKLGIAYLQNELKLVDPLYYSKVDTDNPHRLIRALEIYRATGKTYSSYLQKNRTTRNFRTLIIGLTAERSIIYDRINQRVDEMMAEGLLHETEKLLPHKDLNALQTVGYKELFDYLDGKVTLPFAISEIKKNTRRFAKRQLTWFNKNVDIQWFPFNAAEENIVEYIKAKNAQEGV